MPSASGPVVSYRNSTSNHNSASSASLLVVLYLIEILHQTTTCGKCEECLRRCILSKFYIKPQLRFIHNSLVVVVSYRNSTSNHNCWDEGDAFLQLYLIEILHQTTTELPSSKIRTTLYLIEILHQTTTTASGRSRSSPLYLIEILHQTTTMLAATPSTYSCILSKFYIKPQPRANHIMKRMVVSYRNSTSNHNLLFLSDVTNIVVSYRNSTSNHNFCVSHASRYTVVSYRNSTSNHNNGLINGFLGQLYLIEILHQTTTPG